MSHSPSVGVCGPSDWAYMGGLLARSLQRVLDDGEIRGDSFPPRALTIAQEFFRSVEDEASGSLREPLASITNYIIAATALRAVVATRQSREQMKEQFDRLSRFLTSLENPRTLSDEDRKLAHDLQTFFNQLYEDGESERYSRSVEFSFFTEQ